MARYLRVRSTRRQGAHRAGMFFGIEPQVLDKTELSTDQVRLLRAEDGRLLVVDEVDDPHEPLSMAGAGMERLARAEREASEGRVRIAELEAERDAARAETTALQARLARAEAAAGPETAARPKGRGKPKHKPDDPGLDFVPCADPVP